MLTALAALAPFQDQSPAQAAFNEDFWFYARMAFTVDRNLLNFNTGSFCPAPKVVQESISRYWTVTNRSPSPYVGALTIDGTPSKKWLTQTLMDK